MKTVQDLAVEFIPWFTTQVRGDERIWVLKEGRPEQLQAIVYESHDGMMPDDFKYEFAYEAFAALAEDEDPDDARDSIEADVYNSELTRWLASNPGRGCYVDQAVEEWGWPENIFLALQQGQVFEKREVFDIILRQLEELAEETEDEDE